MCTRRAEVIWGEDMAEKDGFKVLKMGFDHDKVIYVEGETLKKLQHVILGMLEDFIETCKTYDINYSLSGGSILGAVRHQGFIPWDDDVDINISRKDFNKLKEVFPKALSDRYTLYAPEEVKGHGMSLAQIKKKGTVYRSFNELDKKDSGITMDLFVVENTPNNKLLRKLHGILCLGFGYMLTCRKTYEDLDAIKEYVSEGEALKTFEKKAKRGSLLRFISLDRLTKQTIAIYSMCHNDHSKYVTIPSGRKHYFGEMQERDHLLKVKEVPFESIKANIPEDPVPYLLALYGPTYMEVPPVEKREQHPLMELDLGEGEKQ